MKRGSLALCGALGAVAALVFAGGAAAAPQCASFNSQAEAQEAFLNMGGRPSANVGGLDGNGNGVACEQLGGPYAGFATIGFNRRNGFLYGVAALPRTEHGYQCLGGNRYDPKVARQMNVYRKRPGADQAILGAGIDTASNRDEGKLVWRADRPNLPRGRYYAAFEPRIGIKPNRRNQCPGFDSRTKLLPEPRR